MIRLKFNDDWSGGSFQPSLRDVKEVYLHGEQVPFVLVDFYGVDMKANEFIKKYGIEEARKLNNIAIKTNMTGNVLLNIGDYGICISVEELKRLIESRELVEECGGYEQVKLIIQAIPNSLKFYDESGYLMFNPIIERYFQFSNGVSYALLGSAFSVPMYGKSASRLKKDCIYIHDLKQAIADVESCQ